MPLIIKTTGFSDYLANAGGSFIKVLILGEPDSGKTRSASFWPNPIYADCENGRMSIADRQVPYAEITSRADFKALVQRVKQECQKPVGQRLFDTFVLDTADTYQSRILIPERLRDERKEALSGWGDWGWIGAAMEQDIQAILNLPMHVVVNLHVKDEGDGDEESRTLVKKSKLKGDIKDSIAGWFDLVGYMEKSYAAEDGKRVLKRQIRWHSEPRYPMAKDRSGRLPRFTDVDFTDQDHLRIYNAIVGDHLKLLPESVDFESLDTGEVAPAAPDVKGGPVAVEPISLPRVSAAKKTAAKKKAAPKAETAGANPVPAEAEDETQPVTRVTDVDGVGSVDTQTGEVTEEQGVANVTEMLGAEEAEALDPTATTAPAKAASAAPAEPAKNTEGVPVCGDQPPHFRKKYDAVSGCGKGLVGEDRNQVNMALLRTQTYLCNACASAWKASQ